MRPRQLTELVISLIILVLVIQYIAVTIRPLIPYIIAACVLLLIGWVIYTRLKRL